MCGFSYLSFIEDIRLASKKKLQATYLCTLCGNYFEVTCKQDINGELK